MKYLIIGLGIYGTNLAQDLAALGHEVIGADINESTIESLKNYLSAVYRVDSTDPAALGVLPFKNVDLVIVAIGENFGASVKTVALLKEAGVEHIYARAIDPLHHAILECFHLDRILIPEQRAASDLSRELMLGRRFTTMAVTDELIVAKFAVPDNFVGKTYLEITSKFAELAKNEQFKFIAATRAHTRLGLLKTNTEIQEPLDLTDPNLKVEANDVIVCLTDAKALKRLAG